MRDVWAKRADRYSEIRASASQSRAQKVEMYHIGG
jgi:hypothetical protein